MFPPNNCSFAVKVNYVINPTLLRKMNISNDYSLVSPPPTPCQICPHLAWRWMFYLFGFTGFMWVIVWLCCYKDTKVVGDVEEFIEPPKVVYMVVFLIL